VRVHLWGELGFYDRERRHRFELTLPAEMPLADVLQLIGVPAAEVAVAGLNGEVVRVGDPGVTVGDADRLDLFPPSAGGCGRLATGRAAAAPGGAGPGGAGPVSRRRIAAARPPPPPRPGARCPAG
jgi:hypothetical protein